MTALVAVEIRRLLARRLARVLAALAVVGSALAGVIVFFADDDGFHLTNLDDVFTGTSVPLVILSLVVGASFVGAEWHHGTIATTLTWESRRVPLLGGKLAAAVLGTGLAAVAVQAVLAGTLLPAAVFRGSTAGADGEWAMEVAGLALRIGALSGLAAGVGLSLATIGRNTAAALGAAFVYLYVVEQLIGNLRPGWRDWLLALNSAQIVAGPSIDAPLEERSIAVAALVVAAYAGAVFLVATALFQRRDVT